MNDNTNTSFESSIMLTKYTMCNQAISIILFWALFLNICKHTASTFDPADGPLSRKPKRAENGLKRAWESIFGNFCNDIAIGISSLSYKIYIDKLLPYVDNDIPVTTQGCETTTLRCQTRL